MKCLPILTALLATTVMAFGFPLTDYPAAIETAAEQKKPILLEFTGSDWCPPCMMMKKEIFSKPEFQQFAESELVFVELDFPRSAKQAPALRQQNQALAEKFEVQGFPTLILLSSEGKELARNVGFLRGGLPALQEWVKKASNP